MAGFVRLISAISKHEDALEAAGMEIHMDEKAGLLMQCDIPTPWLDIRGIETCVAERSVLVEEEVCATLKSVVLERGRVANFSIG